MTLRNLSKVDGDIRQDNLVSIIFFATDKRVRVANRRSGVPCPLGHGNREYYLTGLPYRLQNGCET